MRETEQPFELGDRVILPLEMSDALRLGIELREHGEGEPHQMVALLATKNEVKRAVDRWEREGFESPSEHNRTLRRISRQAVDSREAFLKYQQQELKAVSFWTRLYYAFTGELALPDGKKQSE